MIKRISDFLRQYSLENKTIIVGFSGGYDSMCLLDILSKIKRQSEFSQMSIIAAHFNHNWRGQESLCEQEVCRLFAASRGFEFYTKIADSSVKKTENDARIARYEFFEEACEEYDADAVFTAHNRDDNAETILYRVIKGTGTIGLRGIAEKRNIFYRPLLKTYRSEILEYCNKENLFPNNDSSNTNIAYKRNYIRLNVFPLLEKINPEVKEALNTLSQNAIRDNEIIEEYIKNIRPKIFDNNTIIVQEYVKLSKPLQLRFLYEYIQMLGFDYDSKKVTEIHDFISKNCSQKNGSTMSLASAKWLYADNKIVEMIPKIQAKKAEEVTPVKVYGVGEYLFDNKIFTLRVYDDDKIFEFPESTSNFAYVDLSKTEFPLILRTRQDGDVITPFGMQGSMKLKKYLNSKGVSRHKRDSIALMCTPSEVLWAAGVGISDKISVTDKPTHVIEIKQV